MDFKKEKKKKMWIGALIGFVTPILASPLVNWIMFIYRPMMSKDGVMVASTRSYWANFEFYLTSPIASPVFLSFCVISIAPMIFIFGRSDQDFIIKGMMYPLFFYAFCVFLIKLGI